MYTKEDIARICETQERLLATRRSLERFALKQLTDLFNAARHKDTEGFELLNAQLELAITELWQLMHCQVEVS